MLPEQWVQNAERLISVYGTWPSFHDAEVISFVLDRDGPCCLIKLACHDRSAEVDESGFYKKLNQRMVILRFTQIDGVSLSNFNHQNVIAAIVMQRKEKIHITIQSIFGLSGQFECSEVVVEDVVSV